MIVATIQGVSLSNNCKHITALNGKLIIGGEQEKHIDCIYGAINEINVENEIFCKVAKRQYFCALCHPKKDEMDRIRTALILYDKHTSEQEISQTLKVMGLDYGKFKELRTAYIISQTPRYALSILGIMWQVL